MNKECVNEVLRGIFPAEKHKVCGVECLCVRLSALNKRYCKEQDSKELLEYMIENINYVDSGDEIWVTPEAAINIAELREPGLNKGYVLGYLRELSRGRIG